MKKRYDSPITEVVIMDVTQNFLEISAHGTQHEGFTGGSDLSLQKAEKKALAGCSKRANDCTIRYSGCSFHPDYRR